MRLRKERIIPNNNFVYSSRQVVHHNKNASMDIPSNTKAKNIYLNKILQKNLGPQISSLEQSGLKDNLSNFQSNIRNILANEETRQKAKNFVLGMRYRREQNSPFAQQSDFNKNRNNMSRTNYDGFYAQKPKNNYVIQENIYRNNNNMKKEVIYQQRIISNRPYSGYNNFENRMEPSTPDKTTKYNKKNNYYEEMPYNVGEGIYYQNNLKNDLNMNRNNSRGGIINMSNINKMNNLNLFRNSKTNYPLNSKKENYQNKQSRENFENLNVKNSPYFVNNFNINNSNNQYDDENDLDYNKEINYENNPIDTNSLSENNNSGLREIIIDNINEIYQSPQPMTRIYDDFGEDENKYSNPNNNTKTYELNNNNNNVNVYNKYKNSSKSKSNFNVVMNTNSTKNISDQKSFSKGNSSSNNKKYNDNYNYGNKNYRNKNVYDNYNIEKYRLRIKGQSNGIDYNSDIMQKIRNRFLENIKAITTSELNIKGNENKNIRNRYDNKNSNEIKQMKNELEMAKKQNLDNENTINNYKNIINKQKKDLDTKINEIYRLKNESNINMNDLLKKI